MSVSKIFNGNIEVTKLLKSMVVGQSLIIEVSEGYTVQEGLNVLTGSAAVRKKGSISRDNKSCIRIEITLDTLTAISGALNDKLSKLIKITKTAEYYI